MGLFIGATERNGPAFGGLLISEASSSALKAYHEAGYDYAVIDLQHSPISERETLGLLSGYAGDTCEIHVRVASNEPGPINKAFDAGANAVIVPMVDTAEEARAAVAAAKYVPRGSRSFGPFREDIAFPKLSLEELNDRANVIIMIETPAGLENVEAIAAVPGVSGLVIGPADLSISLGLPPLNWMSGDDLEGPFKRIGDAARANGIKCGAFANAAAVPRFTKWGMDFLTVAYDGALIRKAAADLLSEVRGSAESAPARTLY